MSITGELAVSRDGEVTGWCYDPADPSSRPWVEILAEGTVILTLPAAQGRPDLKERGIGDGGYGFSGNFSAAALPERPDVLIWARARGQPRGFGQRLFWRPEIAEAPTAREGALARDVAALSRRLERFAPPPPLAPGRAAFGALGARLSPAPEIRLAPTGAARITLLLPVAADPQRALACLRTLAPRLGVLGAALVAQDAGIGDALAFWPHRFPGLSVHGIGAAPLVGLLDPARPTSIAGLSWLLDHAADYVAVFALRDAPESWPDLSLPLPLGLDWLAPRALVDAAALAPRELARAAPQLGLTCRRLAE